MAEELDEEGLKALEWNTYWSIKMFPEEYNMVNLLHKTHQNQYLSNSLVQLLFIF